MTYSAMELKAERSILRSMGLAAVFTTYGGTPASLSVLPVSDYSNTRGGDFTSRDASHKFEALAADLPSDWRDGSLLVNGVTYNVIDVTFDEYGNRALIRTE